MLFLTACFLAAFVFASFLEYWLHRLMHTVPNFGRDIVPHYEHHRENTAHGVLREFKEYSMVVPLFFSTFFISAPVGISSVTGSVVYAAFSAYAHQLQHECPVKCVWLDMPIHYVHHKYNQWDCNFGLAVDCWDKLFGTYQVQDWLTEEELEKPHKDYWQIKW
jgi:sterol desaturase/sphingolipid hydroxylase (fatty acid hydroxylase superfamily)